MSTTAKFLILTFITTTILASLVAVINLQPTTSALETEKQYLITQITELKNNITILKSQVVRLQSEITSLEDEVIQSYNTGYAEGYLQGIEDGANRGWNIRDPTYNEAIAFIKSDKTDENEYTDSYTCHDFTADFKNNAFNTGYRCGYVYIEFPETAHAVACFDTTNNGLIFIEPQYDEIITLTIGQSLYDKEKYEVDFNDIIIDYDIVW